MLHKLGWQSLDGRRQDQRLVLFFKIINGLASVETEDILTPADSRTRKNHSFKFKHLQANCDSHRYSFFPATISSWNNLPFGIEKVDSYLLLVVQPSVYSAWSAIAALHFLFIAFSLDLEVRLLHSFGTIGESSIEHK